MHWRDCTPALSHRYMLHSTVMGLTKTHTRRQNSHDITTPWIQNFSFKETHLKMPSAGMAAILSRPPCLNFMRSATLQELCTRFMFWYICQLGIGRSQHGLVMTFVIKCWINKTRYMCRYNSWNVSYYYTSSISAFVMTMHFKVHATPVLSKVHLSVHIEASKTVINIKLFCRQWLIAGKWTFWLVLEVKCHKRKWKPC